MKDTLDMESLLGQEMQLIRYKEKLKDYIANVFKHYVDVKKPPEAQEVKKPETPQVKKKDVITISPSGINESIEVRADLEEIKLSHKQEIEKLHKIINDLELRVQKVEGIATTIN